MLLCTFVYKFVHITRSGIAGSYGYFVEEPAELP